MTNRVLKNFLGGEGGTCTLCGEEYLGWGNNPWPLAETGKACDACNVEVVKARLKQYK